MFEIFMKLSTDTIIYIVGGIILFIFIVLKLTEKKWVNKTVYIIGTENITKKVYFFERLLDPIPKGTIFFRFLVSESGRREGRFFKSKTIQAFPDHHLLSRSLIEKKAILNYNPDNLNQYKIIVDNIVY